MHTQTRTRTHAQTDAHTIKRREGWVWEKKENSIDAVEIRPFRSTCGLKENIVTRVERVNQLILPSFQIPVPVSSSDCDSILNFGLDTVRNYGLGSALYSDPSSVPDSTPRFSHALDPNSDPTHDSDL
ncbi:hypothetical protein EVAR_64226_1 [Eumeta japonica]|uniref:Uncharacterized protein n=1 Tax=Eumeta variegata TaxID=151549 RepID=A0A4C1ZSY4_EUMVA|nr:hypothetical protein EVAR_64226_1 [Eumeta japonica]